MGEVRFELLGEVEELRARIAAWRELKASPVERMPEALWMEAAALADRYGVSAVSRALGVGYMGLRQRLGEVASAEKGTEAQGGGFVEVGTWPGCGRIRVEVARADGSRMKLEVMEGAASEAVDLLRAFLASAV